MAEADAAPTSRWSLAVSVGLAVALVLGGGAMVGTAWRTTHHPLDCAGMAADECAMEQDIALAWARSQNGLGLAVLGVGVAMGFTLWLTERRRGAPTPRSDA